MQLENCLKKFQVADRRREKLMSKIEDLSFRKLAGNYVLLTNIPMERFQLYNSEFQCLEGDNALLTYGYIDHQASLSFEILCFAKYIPEKRIELRPGNSKISFKIRYDGMVGDVVVLPYDISMAEFHNKVKMVSEGYRYSDDVEEIRKYDLIDSDRHPQFPDDVGALLFKEGVQMEKVWVRTSAIINGKIAGYLLNQPHSSKFDLKRGDMVTLVSVPTKEGRFTVVEIPDIYS